MQHATYAAHGVRFRYPASWELSERLEPGEVSLTLWSPDTAFWSLTLFTCEPDADGPGPQDLVENALETIRAEYPDLDDYPAADRLADRPTFARDAEFVCLELVNSAFLRAFRTATRTALVYYQVTDHELAESRPVLEQIGRSLQCDDEELDEPPDEVLDLLADRDPLHDHDHDHDHDLHHDHGHGHHHDHDCGHDHSA